MPDAKVKLITTADMTAIKQSTDTFASLDKAQQAAAKSALTTAQNMAKLDAAMGQPTAGAKRLHDALVAATALPPGQAAATLKQIDQLEIQATKDAEKLLALQEKLANTTPGVPNKGGVPVLPRTVESFGTQALDQARQQILGLVGPAAAATAAIKGLQGAFDLAQSSAKIDATRKSFDNLAVSAHTTGDALLNGLRAAAKGTVSDADLIQSANSGILLTGGTLAKELPRLLEIARASAQASGDDIGFVFDSLVKGIARGSPQIIDNAKITLDAAGAFETYAKSVGKTPDQLTRAEQQQATLNAVMAAGTDIIAKTGGSAEGAAQSFARLAASGENIKNKLGSDLAAAIEPAATSFSDLLNGMDGTTEGTVRFVQSMGNVTQILTQSAGQSAETAKINRDFGQSVLEWFDTFGKVTPELVAADAANKAYADTLALTGDEAQATIAGEAARAESLRQSTGTVATLGAAMDQERQASAAQSAQTQASTTAQLNSANSMELAGVQARAAALAAQQKSDADKVAAVDAQTHGIAEQQLAEQAMAAARALLAGGSQGQATAAMLAGSSQQVDVLTAAYYRLYNAQRLAGAGATQQQAADFRSMEVFGQTSAQRTTALQKEIAADKARSQGIIQNGTAVQKVTELQRQYDDAVRQSGAGSAQAILAQNALTAATKTGGSARVSAAEKTANRLENLEGSSSEKIQKIVADRDRKLQDLDEKYAEEQLENKRKLANDIANIAGNKRVGNEIDDLDLFGKHSKDEARKLNDRERAEAAARQRSGANAEEARKKAEQGDAEAAQKTLAIREEANQKQQELDEKYYEKQAELANNPEQQAALTKQYEEAQKAIQEQSDREVAQADAMAALKKEQRDKEHDEIVLAAEDAANVAIGHAQRMADSIIKATGTAGDQGSNNLKKIGDAVNAIPKDVTVTVHINQQGSTSVGGGSSSSGSGTKAAGGFHGVTSGPTTLTVGDNPGGMELVSVIPISGTGQTSIGPNMMKMAGGGTALIDSGGGYTTIAAVGSDDKKKSGGKSATDAVKSAIDQQKDAISLLQDLIQLRHDLNEELQNGQPFDTQQIQFFAFRAAQFLSIVLAQVIPVTKKNGEAFKLYVDAAKEAIDILSSVASLRKDVADALGTPPFDTAQIQFFAFRASQFLQIVQAWLVPVSESQVDALNRYKDASEAAMGILKDVADLRKALSESLAPALDLPRVAALASDAAQVTAIIRGFILPTTKEQGEALALYHDAAEASISIIKDTTDLGKTLSEDAGYPIDVAMVQRLARDAVRVTQIVEGSLLPTTEDQGKALSAYGDAVGSSVGIIKDVSGLTGDMFADYRSPSDAQINRVAADAKRVTTTFIKAASTFKTEGITAGKDYADAVGATFGAVTDGLKFFEALNSGDYKLNVAALRQFESATVQTLGVVRRLGAIAVTIPAGHIAALGVTTQALSDQSEALIKHAAVPWGDIQPAAAGLNRQANTLLNGASAGQTIINFLPGSIVAAPGMNVNQLADVVIKRLNAKTGAYK